MATHTAATGRSESVIPPSAGAPEREEDKGRKVQVNYRSPPGLAAFIESMVTSQDNASRVIVFGLNFYRDVYETMGVEWWELQKRAAIDRVRPGVLAGRLILEALRKGPKR